MSSKAYRQSQNDEPSVTDFALTHRQLQPSVTTETPSPWSNDHEVCSTFVLWCQSALNRQRRLSFPPALPRRGGRGGERLFFFLFFFLSPSHGFLGNLARQMHVFDTSCTDGVSVRVKIALYSTTDGRCYPGFLSFLLSFFLFLLYQWMC